MKHKHWLAAGGMAALGTGAWAQGSSVEMFGIVDVHINSAKSGATRLSRLEDGGSAASRVGFRGREDLGGGLRAQFMLEAGVAPDTGLGTIPGPGLAFTRQAFVGLHGGWGSMEMGRMYTPMFSALFRADPLGMNALFSSLNLVSATDAQPGMRPFAARANNMLRYRTPASQPWLVDLAYAFGEAPSPHSSNGRLHGATLGWNQKPWFLAYSFQKSVEGSAAAPVATPATSHYQALSASWDALDPLRLTGNYVVNRVDRSGTPKAKLVQLGAEWSLDARSRLLASVARREVGGTDRAQNTWTLGYDYALSKRTQLYARWLQLGNAANASAAIANVPVATNSGDGVRSLALGVRHNF
ncbi:Outer membrane porin protein 32 precursor [Delftia tsuruhatensis]|uniref:porin n=1 Tax=Delftia tsuruhatensis TaxID=180282 RepID=UPI001E7DC911|nr:porin [Delftia tsuruhatensis]CAB5713014.1 Outer membrane porin protein 32 precursor [Delftia tsuruhatensis]CAC9691863.1 Outer membrane porin protein 32 precursor [Delftia tsuruhatensis]